MKAMRGRGRILSSYDPLPGGRGIDTRQSPGRASGLARALLGDPRFVADAHVERT